jgi:cyclophilin family peptidyl-prolyl cis-trans isomerase
MQFSRKFLFLAAITATLAILPVAAEDPVKAVLELRGSFLYSDDPILTRLSIGNEGPEVIPNPVKASVLKGFFAKDSQGKPIKATGKTTAQEPTRPDNLHPMAFYGTIVNLAELFPQLSQPGRYSIGWESGGVVSQVYDITVIPRYDPSKIYQATIETGLGNIVIDFFPDEAPIAVKAFIDMANSGFYNGLFISEAHSNDFIVAGDPAIGDNGQLRPVTYPAEPTKLPMVAGTVIMKPVMASPPGNSSTFMILLGPKPTLRGQATAFGQVIQGLDVARKISQRPVSGVGSKAKFKPIKDIEIIGVTIAERTANAR